MDELASCQAWAGSHAGSGFHIFSSQKKCFVPYSSDKNKIDFILRGHQQLQKIANSFSPAWPKSLCGHSMASVTFAGGREDTLQRFLDPDHCQELKIQSPLTLFAQRSVCYRELLHAQVRCSMARNSKLCF